MRTARLIAIDAKGNEKVICPASTPFGDSLTMFRKYERDGKLPSGAVELVWQANDSLAKTVKLKPALVVAEKQKEEK